MSERLTTEQIAALQRIVDGDDGVRPIMFPWMDRALAELRERREADARATADGSSAVITMGSKSLDAMLASTPRLTAPEREALVQ